MPIRVVRIISGRGNQLGPAISLAEDDRLQLDGRTYGSSPSDLLLCGWEPIDTAPKDGNPVHLGFRYMAGWDVIAHWSTELNDWSLSGDDTPIAGRPKPTHWRSLPNPPTT